MGLYVIIRVYFGNYPIPFSLDIRETYHLKINSCSMPAEISYSATHGLGSFSEDNSPKMLLFHLSIQHKGVILWLYLFVISTAVLDVSICIVSNRMTILLVVYHPF